MCVVCVVYVCAAVRYEDFRQPQKLCRSIFAFAFPPTAGPDELGLRQMLRYSSAYNASIRTVSSEIDPNQNDSSTDLLTLFRFLFDSCLNGIIPLL